MSLPLRNSKDFGALIRDRRRDSGLSQDALARAIGVSRLWVNQVEKGKPRAELALVLRALDVLGVRLLAGQDPPATSAPDIDDIVDRARGRKP
jgi:HTH-type transcriptional regulator/antitoxin HipB